MIKTKKGFGRPDVTNQCYLGSNPYNIKPGTQIPVHRIHQYCHGNSIQTSVTNEYDMSKSPKVYSSGVTVQLTCSTYNYLITQAVLLGKTYSNKKLTLSKLQNLNVKNTQGYDFEFFLTKPIFIGNNQGYKNSQEWIKSVQIQVFGSNLPPSLYIIQRPYLKMHEHFVPIHHIKENETMSPIQPTRVWVIVSCVLVIILICFLIFIFCQFKK